LSTGGWGPDGCRAAISATFETLAAGPESEPATVTPALPTLLEVLAERDLSATFFVPADVPDSEPAALTMIASGWNEIGALAPSDGDPQPVLEALHRAGRPAVGIRSAQSRPRQPDQAGLRYISAPGQQIATGACVVHIPVDRMLSDAAFLAPGLLGRQEARPGGAPALHHALQVAIAGTLERGQHLTLTFFPGLLDRAETLGVFIETLDLVHGLRRASRLWLPTLEELAGWWLETGRRA
jgi:hypothetical protein